MITDAQLLFSDAQAVTATILATNVIDLTVSRALGTGRPMAVLFGIDVAAKVSATDETYQFDIETASDAGITTARKLLNRRIFQATVAAPAQAAALLVAGFTFYELLPAQKLSESERYLGVRYTTGGTGPTITVTVMLMPADMIEQTPVNVFPRGYTITG